MEIGVPTYHSSNMSYSFQILKSNYKISSVQNYEPTTWKPDLPATTEVSEAFVKEFLEKSKKYFTNPLTTEKVMRHLRHTVGEQDLPKFPGYYSFVWKPSVFVVKAGDFALSWQLVEAKEQEPVIPAEFIPSTTPRAQSPSIPEQTPADLRNIQIRDSLIPVGDLPLSDLPPLSFGTEEVDPEREEIKQRIREARLKLQLAKLKAQRMEQKYFERYGQTADESGDSSDFSSESEEGDELPF